MSKKQALTEFHRGSILAAAERLFAEKGTEKTTMDDIAREAEYSKATLYVYFQSKEEIIHAILLSGLVLLHKKLHEAMELESWQEVYEAVCLAIIRFYEENPSTYEAVTAQLSVVSAEDGADSDARELERMSAAINRDLMEFLERGRSQGFVHTTRPLAETILIFWASLSGMVRAAEQVEPYLKRAFDLDRSGFLRDGTRLLLDAVSGVQYDG